jgi:hypothetical protein
MYWKIYIEKTVAGQLFENYLLKLQQFLFLFLDSTSEARVH